MYIAVTYIGSTYVPGEIISEDTPKEKLDWLKRAGAIREDTPAQPAPAEAGEIQAGEAEAENEDTMGWDEPEITPDIDVADGIVKTPEEAAGADKKKGRSRK